MPARYNLKLRFIVSKGKYLLQLYKFSGKTDDTKSTIILEDSPDKGSRGVKRSNERHPTAVKSRKITEEKKCTGQLSEVCSKSDCKKSSNFL